MEEKEKELLHSKRKTLINKILSKLSQEETDLYYLPTIQIAAIIHQDIVSGKLSRSDTELLEGLSVEDVQVLLSHHDKNGRI